MTESKTADQLAQIAARGIEASHKTSATRAGPTDEAPVDRSSLIEAINQVFALFRLNYANQFYAAWSDADQLNQAKRLWLDALGNYPPQVILRGAKHAMESSEYLPNIHRMLTCCQHGFEEMGLPNPRAAYLEACNAPSPKAEQRWSHPAVYHAGCASDWFFLANNPEAMTWPVFKERYLEIVARASQGEVFALPDPAAGSARPVDSLSIEERRAQLAALREANQV